LPAPSIAVDIHHDLQQPRAKCRVATIAPPALEYAAQRFLDDVLGSICVAGQPQRKTQCPGQMLHDQSIHRASIDGSWHLPFILGWFLS
jgi:hypothetical protein